MTSTVAVASASALTEVACSALLSGYSRSNKDDDCDGGAFVIPHRGNVFGIQLMNYKLNIRLERSKQIYLVLNDTI